jgi:Fe-Mn family superoxide dismutase
LIEDRRDHVVGDRTGAAACYMTRGAILGGGASEVISDGHGRSRLSGLSGLGNHSMMETYTLPDLPYDYAALEPHVSARIMQLHHDKHHAGYVKQANATLDRLVELRAAGGGDAMLLRALEKSLAFNVSGHLLHAAFWPSMRPDGGGRPEGELAAAIDETFGGYDALRRQMTEAVASLQGSGWGALVWEPLAGRLIVEQIYDHQGNMTPANVPLLVVDGWEHAYYLQYENDKERFVEAFFEIADWEQAARRFEHTRRLPALAEMGDAP